MKTYIAQEAAAYQERFPDKDIEDLKDWARSPASNAFDWLRRLGLPHPTLQQFATACYDD